jgi:SAM-dependent methyltransferase
MNIKSFIYWKLFYPIICGLDKIKGLDFLPEILPEDVGLNPALSFRSSPSSKGFLQNVLQDFHVSSQDSIIDIGCGKGYAMRTMQDFPFKNINGLELSDQIATIAKKNFKILKDKRIQVFTSDASLFSLYDNYNIVYLFNPFPAEVMEVVIECLVQSVKRKHRELVIIYMNPTCDVVINNSTLFNKIKTYHKKYNAINVYANFVTQSRFSLHPTSNALLGKLRLSNI